MPDCLISIEHAAFYGCKSLKSIRIPRYVNNIKCLSFCGCSNLSEISVSEKNIYYDSRENCNAIIETSTNKLIRGGSNTIIPSSIVSIGNSSFSYCHELTEIYLPDNIESIGYCAFYNCSLLKNIRFPNNKCYIYNHAFKDCPQLIGIDVPKHIYGDGVRDLKNSINAPKSAQRTD